MEDLSSPTCRVNVAELVEAIPLPIFIKTEEGVHVFCNDLYLAILKVKREEVIGFKIEDFAPQKIVANALFHDKKIRESGFRETCSYRTTFEDKTGGVHNVDIMKGGVPFTYGGKRLLIGCVLDVSEQVRYREELAAQHKFLRMVIDNLPQLIYTKDTDSRFTLANNSVAQVMTGRPDPSLLIGRTDAEFFRPDLWVKYYNDEQELMRTGRPLLNIVEPCTDREGNTRWNVTSKIPLFDESGRVTGLIGIGSDFTAFKKNEEQLRLQATALETAADGILITDVHGTILWCNSAMTTVSGYGMGELVGFSTRILRSGVQTDSFYHKLWEEISAGKNWSGEIVNRRKDGALRTEEVTITPVADDKGRVTHFVAIYRDITERQLQRQEMSRIYSAVTEARDGILMLAQDNTPLFANHSFGRLSGYPMTKLPAGLLEAIAGPPGEDPRWMGNHIRQVDLPAAEGPVPVEIRDWRVRGEEGEDLGRVFVLRDLREERKAEEMRKMMEVRLRQAQKLEAIGQLAAGIAHEINNPIQFVGNNTTFLKTCFEDMEQLIEAQRRALEKAGGADLAEVREVEKRIDYDYLKGEVPQAVTQTLDGIRRVSEIVKAMKDFSHPGSKNRQRMDVNKAVRDAVLVARNEWKYDSDVETDLAMNLPMPMCLVNEMNQVLLNILVNAAHATGEAVKKGLRKRGLITIKTEADDCEVRILVTDNGTGIPAAIRDRIFEPFFTTKEVGKGTGQGLAIAYDVAVRKHGGRLTFSSVENEGTTFVVAIPIGEHVEEVK